MNADSLIGFALGVAVGLAAGLAVQVWWVRDDSGDRRVRVALSNNWQRAFFVIVSVLVLGSVLYTARANTSEREQTDALAAITAAQQQQVARQTFCNRELIRVINANTAITADDRRLLDELLAAVGAQVLATDTDRATRQKALADAFTRYEDQRAANAAARQPYPPPDCGVR